jgi:multicomponent Na+:H+ antiporter subunit D
MTSPLAPLALAVPLTAAALLAAIGRRIPRWLAAALSIAAALFSLGACVSLASVAAHGTIVDWFGGWTPRHGVALGIAFVVDPIGGALAAFTALLTTAAFAFAWTYYEEAEGALHPLMLVFMASLIGFFLTGDAFNLFVFFELMSVSAYALTGYRTEDESAVEGALAFGVVNSAGAFLVLLGIAMLYARTGALAMAQLAHALAGGSDPLIVVAFALVVAGFLVKAASVPFHFWLSEAHAVAPTPLCVLFSGIMVEAGLYAVARMYWSVFSGALGGHEAAIRGVLVGFGVLTMLVGATMCFVQRHLKRLLAFSTIAHGGIMLCAFALFSPAGLAGLFLYVLGHGLLKGGLFMCSGIVLNRFGSVDIDELCGKLRDHRWTPAAMAFGALGLAGLPPFGTFLGKALIDDAAHAAGFAWLPPLALLASALTSAALLRAAGRIVFGWGPPRDRDTESPAREEPEADEEPAFPLMMYASALVLLACSFGFGFVAHGASAVLAASERFIDRPLQLAVVLNGTPSGPIGTGAPVSLSAGIGWGIASTLLALVFAALGLFGHRLAGLRHAMRRICAAPLHALRAAHSGLVTDYVAWFTLGTAALGVALTLAIPSR